MIGCLYGRFFAIEVKRPGEIPTPLQCAEMRSIQLGRGFAIWTDSYEAVVSFVQEVKRTIG